MTWRRGRREVHRFHTRPGEHTKNDGKIPTYKLLLLGGLDMAMDQYLYIPFLGG